MKGGSEAVFFGEMDLLKDHGHAVIPFSMAARDNLPSEYSSYFVDEVSYTESGLSNKLVNASKIIYSFDAKKK